VAALSELRDKPAGPSVSLRRACANATLWPALTKQATADASRPDGSRLHQLAPSDLRCLYTWEFEKNGREVNVRVEGQTRFTTSLTLDAALARVPARRPGAGGHRGGPPGTNVGRLVPAFSGYHLYYQVAASPLLRSLLLVEALRHRRQEHKSVEKTASKRVDRHAATEQIKPFRSLGRRTARL